MYALTDPGTSAVSAWRVAQNGWGENTLTYANEPQLGAELSRTGAFGAGTWAAFEMTPAVTGNGLVSVGLSSASGSTHEFATRESATAPRLVVETGATSGVPTPAPTPTPALSPSPAPTPTPAPTTRPGWSLLFEDNFDGVALNAAWQRYGETSDWPGHSGNGLRVARAVSVQNGRAVITAKEVANVIESGAFTMRAAAYRTTYGRFEARLRVDADPTATMSGVALLWNVDESAHPWYVGENDFWETGGNHADWNSFVHYRDASSQVSCTHRGADGRLSDATVWHDVVLEWEANRMQVFVDGFAESSCRWIDPVVIPDWPQRLTFQLDALDADLGAAIVRMEVDRAAIYRRVTP
jgi:hypothetical protein